MPASDQCHEQVIRALKSAGWVIVRENFPLAGFQPQRHFQVDLQVSFADAENPVRALLIEVKCFQEERRDTTELYTAIGQYMVYRDRIEQLRLEFDLYLVVPESVFNRLFNAGLMQMIKRNRIKIVVIDVQSEVVVKWLPKPMPNL